MKIAINKRIRRAFKTIAIVLVLLVASIVLIPELFPGYVATEIKKISNEKINGEVSFSKARLSLISHFPSLTLSLYQFSVKGSAPFKNDTLVAGNELAFGIDIGNLIGGRVVINKILLDKTTINVQVDSTGAANYNIYKSTGTELEKADTASSDAQLKIEKIGITNSDIVYNDRSLPMMIKAHDFNYEGKGDLSKQVFDLQSQLESKDFNFWYDGEPYVLNKDIHAKLITKINTHSLALKFEKNDLLINQLPVDFKGSFDFLENGYAIDLHFSSGNTTLRNVFTILPPAYLKWLDDVDLKGDAKITASVTGKYIASTNTNPAVACNMQVRNGFIQHLNSPEAVSNLFLQVNTVLPNLDADSLKVDIDSIAFNIKQDYLRAAWHSSGIDPLTVNTHVSSRLNLATLAKAIGLKTFSMAGLAAVDFNMDGIYKTGQNPARIRPDTVITSIPNFTFSADLKQGYYKHDSLPEAIKNVSINVSSHCKTNNYRDINLVVKDINAEMAGGFIKGFFALNNLENVNIKSGLTASVDLASIKKAIPLKDVDIAGKLNLAIDGNGNYLPAKKAFPTVNASLTLKDGYLKTGYYPNAISDIEIDALLTDHKANLSDLKVAIKPLHLKFEDQPFTVTANLSDFDNLHYDITANGSIDIAKIYKVFSQKGIDAGGIVKADINLHGTQLDAISGKYHKLNNKGLISLKDVTVTDDNYPYPFYINSALFTFNNDRVAINKLIARYAKNQLEASGSVSNIIAYALQNGVLQGNLVIESPSIKVDDFMAFAGPQTSAPSTGVVLLPTNISIVVLANAAHVDYNGLIIKNLSGKMLLDSGKLTLDSTHFNVADAVVALKAGYASINPKKANFYFEVKADSFDIHKAYKEIKLFRDLATSAGKAYGIVSLNYKLAGKLNDEMMPVYPSLKGGGVLELQNVKVNGLKLFSALSKASGKDSISNPNLKKVAIKSSIANNLVTIEKVKMKVFGFRPRFEGQTSFDGQLNLKGRIGLPPLGIIGLPFSVTGTSTNPIVKMKRNEEALAAVKEEEEE